MANKELSNDQWAVALSLFARVVDGADLRQILAGQRDERIRAALEGLWHQHQQAEKVNFLDEQVTLVSEAAGGAPPVFHSGQMLAGRFAILRVLGRGGMGEVYLADDQLLMETIALKTIKRQLTKDSENSARFLTEVQNARRVTHPNVCRIFDLFEHDGIAFFSMEYLAGPTLAEVLAAGPIKPERARSIATQAAEGLLTAHAKGILHCDFKPANIILTGSGKTERAVITDFGLARALGRTDPTGVHKITSLAGTPPFMAPELLAGRRASVRTDIYAFGKVLELLLPGNKLALECTATHPAQRPESFELVLEGLRGRSSRRAWVQGALLAAAGLSFFAYEHSRPRLLLNTHQRVRVNGFTPQNEDASRIVRSLLILALRQSPLLSVVGDRPYLLRSGTTPEAAGFALPISDLLNTAREEKANLAIQGHLKTVDKGLRLTIKVYDPNSAALLYSNAKEVSDSRKLVDLAELAADDLRFSAFGESAPHSRYISLEKIASPSPEAVDFYFRAVFFYEKSEAAPALALIDQAIAIDPDFALAHHYRALILTAQARLESALESEERAFALRVRVSDRERNWIESQYYNITRNWSASALALQKNTLLFPDEAVFQRQLAYSLVRLGRFDEAIPYNRRAIELDPISDNNRSELLVNLAEANHMEEFFSEAQKMRSAGRLPSLIHRDLALAYLQKDQYEQSLEECRLFGTAAADRESAARLMSVPALILAGRFTEAIHLMQGDLALDANRPEAEKEQTDMYMRRNALGQLYHLTEKNGLAAEQAECLVNLHPLSCNLIHLREGAALAIEVGEITLAERGLDSLATIARRWPSPHAEGAVWLNRAMLAEAGGNASAEEWFAKAKGLWPDPVNLFYIARWEGRAGLFQAQLGTLEELERRRGTVYKHHFAGLTVLGWVEQANCFESLSRFPDSLRMYDRVLNIWSNPQVTGDLMRRVRKERAAVQRRLQ